MKRDPLFPSPRHEIDRLFDTLVHTAWGGVPAESSWRPAVDIAETAEAYVVEIELPGVHASEASITAAGGLLRIEGRRVRSERSGRHHLLLERRAGHFSRTFRLPEDADANEIRARMNEGVLTVEIPKRRAGRGR